MQYSGLQGRNVDHTEQILVPSIPPPSDHPHGKLLDILNSFNFLTHACKDLSPNLNVIFSAIVTYGAALYTSSGQL